MNPFPEIPLPEGRSLTVAFPGDIHFIDAPAKSRHDAYFDALIDKATEILDENDVVVWLGDLFDRPTMPVGSLYRVVQTFIPSHLSGKPVYSIVGNHDVPSYNVSSLRQTSLGFLDLLGLVKVVEGLKIGPVTVGSIPFGATTTFPDTAGVDILLGHCFYQSGADPAMSLKREDVEASGVPYIVLGHDHEPHKPLTLGSTRLLRPGSICRNTSHTFQITRMPEYVRFRIGPGGIEGMEVVPVKCARPGLEVFRPEAIHKPSGNDLSFLSNLSGILDRFQRAAPQDGRRITVRSTLLKNGVPEPFVEYIRSCYDRAGIPFS